MASNKTIVHDYFSMDMYPEARVTQYLYMYIPPILLLLGTIGNCLTFYIMRKLSYRIWSTCLYLCALSIVELVILYVECGNKWLIYLLRRDISYMIMITADTVCKTYVFVFNVMIHVSVWLAVLSMIECLLSLRNPTLAKSVCTREYARALIILIIVLLTCTNIHFFWTYGLVGLTPAGGAQISLPICTYTKEWSEMFQNVIWPITNFLVGELLPLIVVLIICVIITVIQIRVRTSQIQAQLQERRNTSVVQYFLDIEGLKDMQRVFRYFGYWFTGIHLLHSLWAAFEYMSQQSVEQNLAYDFRLNARLKLIQAFIKLTYYIFLSMKVFLYYHVSRCFKQEVFIIFKGICRIGRKKKLEKNKSGVPKRQLPPSTTISPLLEAETVLDQDDPSPCVYENQVTRSCKIRSNNGSKPCKNATYTTTYSKGKAHCSLPNTAVYENTIPKTNVNSKSHVTTQTPVYASTSTDV